MSNHKLIRVVLEYDDEIQTLEGDAAASWERTVNGCIVIADVHGYHFPVIEWRIEKREVKDEN